MSPRDSQSYNALKVRFSATMGEELEVEVALVYLLRARAQLTRLGARCVFSEVWPAVPSEARGARVGRTAQTSTHPIHLSVDAPPPVPQYYRQGKPMEGESRWEN